MSISSSSSAHPLAPGEGARDACAVCLGLAEGARRVLRRARGKAAREGKRPTRDQLKPVVTHADCFPGVGWRLFRDTEDTE